MVACLHVKLNWESSLRWQREREGEKKRNFDWVTVPESEKEFNVECITMYQKERHKAMLTKIHHRDTTLKSLHRQKNKINLHISHLPDYSVLFFLKSETKKKTQSNSLKQTQQTLATQKIRKTHFHISKVFFISSWKPFTPSPATTLNGFTLKFYWENFGLRHSIKDLFSMCQATVINYAANCRQQKRRRIFVCDFQLIKFKNW